MFRAVVAFLAGLPMLMPPGMCLCQFLPRGEEFTAPPARQALSSGEVADASDETCDCRCGHRHQRANRDDSAPDEIKTALRSAALSDCERPTSHLPANHQPGCPAATGASPTKTPMAAVPAQTPDLAAGVVTLLGDADSCNRMCHEPMAAPLAPPLFLSHCSLLI